MTYIEPINYWSDNRKFISSCSLPRIKLLADKQNQEEEQVYAADVCAAETQMFQKIF